MIVRIFSLLAFSLIFNACSGQQASQTKVEKDGTPTFEMVAVPSVITEPAERAEYLAKHYWDTFDFTDTTYIHFPEITEQAVSNYIGIVNYVSPETASSSLKQMMAKAAADSVMFSYFAGLYEKYLYDPNSPLRNETLYVNILESVLAAPVWDEVNKIRPAHLLELALKNKVGSPATDFTYTRANGEEGRLYGLKADYLLLFFYNPDCHACKELTDQLASSGLIKGWLQEKYLKILAVYPDEDLTAWKNHLSYMPTEWVNSYDKTLSIKNDEVYDLKAIPTLYLLDKAKKVILKDATFNQIEDFLQEQKK